MIHRWEVIKLAEDYYRQCEAVLYSPESAENLAADLFADRFPGEATWYLARAKEGTQFITEVSSTSHAPFYGIPAKARRRLTPKQRRDVERGKPVYLYACIY